MILREKQPATHNVINKPIGYFDQNRMETVLAQKNIKVQAGKSIEETLELILQAAANLK